jgi:hypothetical protein
VRHAANAGWLAVCSHGGTGVTKRSNLPTLLRKSSRGLDRIARALIREEPGAASVVDRIGRGLAEELIASAAVLRACARRLRGSGHSSDALARIIRGQDPLAAIDERSFAAAVRDDFRAEFEPCSEVSRLMGDSLVTARKVDTPLKQALDILMTQAYSAHLSVRQLCEAGHANDGATIARRLLELSVRAAYLTLARVPEEDRRRELDEFLGRLWTQLTPEMQARIPDRSRVAWEGAAAEMERRGRSSSTHWRDMFKAIGKEAMYEEDYRILSDIAHGRPLLVPLERVGGVVPVRNATLVRPVLRVANRYALALALCWNGEFEVIPQDVFRGVADRLADA